MEGDVVLFPRIIAGLTQSVMSRIPDKCMEGDVVLFPLIIGGLTQSVMSQIPNVNIWRVTLFSFPG